MKAAVIFQDLTCAIRRPRILESEFSMGNEGHSRIESENRDEKALPRDENIETPTRWGAYTFPLSGRRISVEMIRALSRAKKVTSKAYFQDSGKTNRDIGLEKNILKPDDWRGTFGPR